jgi:hypothetical protein
MSGKSRALAVAAAAAGLVALWAPAALATTTKAPAPQAAHGWLVNGGVVNGGLVNVNLGSGNTAIGNTCNNTNETAPVPGNVLTWAFDISHNSCVMAGGPNHF